MQFTEPDSRCWQGALCQSRWIRFPFGLCWHHSYFGVTMGRTSVYLGSIAGQTASVCWNGLCHFNIILTERSKKRENEICWHVRSEPPLRVREGVPHPSWESGSYRFCLSLSCNGAGVDTVATRRQTSWENISKKKCNSAGILFWILKICGTYSAARKTEWTPSPRHAFGITDKNRGEGISPCF